MMREVSHVLLAKLPLVTSAGLDIPGKNDAKYMECFCVIASLCRHQAAREPGWR